MTKIIRKIDELGRIVLPKEIRQELNIREGEILELDTDNKQIIISKKNILKEITKLETIIVNNITNFFAGTIIITDRDSIIATNTPYLNKNISNDLFQMMNERKKSFIDSNNYVNICKDFTGNNFYFCPILANSNVLGAIIYKANTEFDKNIVNIIDLLSAIIGDYTNK